MYDIRCHTSYPKSYVNITSSRVDVQVSKSADAFNYLNYLTITYMPLCTLFILVVQNVFFQHLKNVDEVR